MKIEVKLLFKGDEETLKSINKYLIEQLENEFLESGEEVELISIKNR